MGPVSTVVIRTSDAGFYVRQLLVVDVLLMKHTQVKLCEKQGGAGKSFAE